MGALADTKWIPVEQYLSSPAYQHSEYEDGIPVELNVGTKQHSAIQVNLAWALKEHARAHPGSQVYTELRCRLNIAGGTHFRLPDVTVVLKADERPGERFLEGAPDLAVEIRSPEDPVSWLVRKAGEYIAGGAQLVWIVLPEEKSVLIVEPGGKIRTAMRSEKLDGGPVLPDLDLAVDGLFE